MIMSLGCDTGARERRAKHSPTGSIYGGESSGCKAMYNPMYCADKFKPSNVLNGDVNGSDDATLYFKDDNGTVIHLSPAETKEVIEIIRGNE